MEIVAALWIDTINFRKEFEGGPTKIDITGAYFSTTAPGGVFPATLTPHLVVLLRAEHETARSGTLEATFVHVDSGEEAGRHRAPVMIQPPGQFFYQLVRPELTFEAPGTLEARCVIPETGSAVTIPLTVMM
jgi:hypothetical protein